MRSTISSLSTEKCRACRISPTAMLNWNWRMRWLVLGSSAACSQAEAMSASWCF